MPLKYGETDVMPLAKGPSPTDAARPTDGESAEVLTTPIVPITWTEDYRIRLLDQTRLPEEERSVELGSVGEVAEAIRSLRVRGAPLIGIAAAMGVVQAVRTGAAGLEAVEEACRVLGATRPTAVNLQWALERMRRRAIGTAGAGGDGDAMRQALIAEADAIWTEDRAMCARIGALGAELLPDPAVVLTHCNAGVLATGGIGTALAPLYTARAAGRTVSAIVGETRPLLQGSRLTAWELTRSGIPCTLMADSMAAARLARGDISCVIVGADRIAANGDVANKIGTYTLALLARAHSVPFYVAAPRSTIDLATPDGAHIPIEQRAPDEVARWAGRPIAPAGVSVWNPAFDVTPASLITAIITDVGVVEPGRIESGIRGWGVGKDALPP